MSEANTPDVHSCGTSNPAQLTELSTMCNVLYSNIDCKSFKKKALRHRHRTSRDTSIAAFQSHDEDTAARRRNRVYRCIAERGGATCWEVEQALGALHQTISAAISKLSADGVLVDTGERRRTGSGRKAIVWGVAR